jgi:hypothetical protein
MRRPRGKTARRVVETFMAHPDWTSYNIGAALGLHPSYIRAALKRNGLKLMRRRGRRVMTRAEGQTP